MCYLLISRMYIVKAEEMLGVQGVVSSRRGAGQSTHAWITSNAVICQHDHFDSYLRKPLRIASLPRRTLSSTERTHHTFITILIGYSDRSSAAAALVFYQPTEFQPVTSNNLDPPGPSAVERPPDGDPQALLLDVAERSGAECKMTTPFFVESLSGSMRAFPPYRCPLVERQAEVINQHNARY